MKREAFIAIGVGLVFLACIGVDESFARGRGGFGGGGSRGGGGYGGAAMRSPSMSGHSRPTHSAAPSRPKPSHQAATRPSRPSPSRPSSPPKQISQRPNVPNVPAQRPSQRPATRPSQSQVNQFLNLPQQPAKGGHSDLAKVGAGVAAGALGAEGARRLIEGSRGPEHPGEGLKPSPLPAGPEGRPGLGDRPELGERPGPGDRPGPGERPGLGERPGIGNRPPGPPSQDRPHQPVADRAHADKIRNNLENRWDNLFTPQWWRDHPQMAKKYWDETGKYQWARHHWWRHATWAAATAWVVGGAYAGYAYQEPIIYDYGDNVYYSDESVYVQGQNVGTAQEYYDQGKALAASSEKAPAEPDADWLPLGVFALSQGGVPDTNMMIQLALSKEGVIKGTYFNTATDTVRPIKGMVDKKTQRVAWTFADGKNTDIIMETGLYNLTQDQTEALVHFGNNKTQQWLLVRLNEPDKAKQEAGK